jgi:hypothetical protein
MTPTNFQGQHTLGVKLYIMRPFGGNVGLLKNRLYRTLGHACIAINAVVGIDIELHVVLIKTVTWADDDAVRVLAVVTGFADDKSHGLCSFLKGGPRKTSFGSFANRVPSRAIGNLLF